MTIQDALERAKQMRRTREASAPVPVAQSLVAADSDTDAVSLTAAHDRTRARAAPVRYPELERVAFDPEACRQHRVLFTDEQLGDMGHAAAAYRQLRSRVLHRVRGSNWSCIGITSSGPGEGKTLTTVNLAISIAREKQRDVYLLDLDMRNPSVFESVGVKPPRCIADFFTGIAPAEQVLFSTDVDRLMMAGSLDAVRNASELLASPRLDELLAYIRRRAPDALILIDLPPTISTDEALVVAPRTDAMFMVVCQGKTRREGLARAVNLLGDFTLAGMILNRSTEALGGDYYSY